MDRWDSLAATLLREARAQSGVGRHELARRSGVARSQIVRIEGGRIQPSLPTLGRLLDALGAVVDIHLAVRDGLLSAAVIAGQVAEELAVGNEDRAFRTCIALHENLSAAPPSRLAVLVKDPPNPSGDSRYDALIAAIVEDQCMSARVAIPQWTSEPSRLCVQWYASDIPGLEDLAARESPPAFRRHGILILPTELSRA